MIDEYFRLQKEIHEYFGYVEDWCVFPIEDRREVYWSMTDGEVYHCFSESNMEKLVEADFDWQDPTVDEDDVYSDEIYHNRFLPKAEYRREDYTMILVDTNTDGNKFLAIYNNANERRRV